MSKCIIIGSIYHGEEMEFLKKEPGDLLLCADAGLEKALQYGFRPDLVIGDFDSMPEPHETDIPLRVLPVKKDDTDTAVCIQAGREKGYREFRIGGGLGGRFDHSLANLQCLADCAGKGEQGWLVDQTNRLTVLGPGSYVFEKMAHRKVSLFAFTERVQGITLRGTEWELEDAELTQTYPLGCSNWFKEEHFRLSFRSGLLVLAFCGDECTVHEENH